MSSPRIAVMGSIAYDFLSQYDRPFSDVLLTQFCNNSINFCFIKRSTSPVECLFRGCN